MAKSKMVVVKFDKQAAARNAGAAFTTADAKLSRDLQNALAAHPGAQLTPLFTGAGDRSAAKTKAAESPEVRAAADTLTQYYRTDVDEERAEALAEQLRNLPGVLMAYVEPEYDVASKVPDRLTEGMVLTAACPPSPLICPPGPFTLCPPSPLILATPDFSSRQTYLEPAASGGMDARSAWTRNGGKGLNMRFADVEFGWNVTHEDLNTTAATPTFGGNTNDNHGTAVLGEIIGKHNGFGVMGIAPDATVGVLCSISTQSLAQCISHAAGVLAAGDVILIEIQSDFRPVEVTEAVYDAIVAAVALGVVVVEAAGNGSYDLDAYVRPAAMGGGGNIFRRTVRDSGAILVGSACPPSGAYGPHRSRWQWSNFGSRLDVQGQGREVCTTGYGDLFDAGPNRRYTADFQNTSAASPQIVGAALCIQGIRKASANPVLTPAELRTLLVSTGSAQVNGNYGAATQQIGPQPDLARAYSSLYPTVFCPGPIVLKCPPSVYWPCKPGAAIKECKTAPFNKICPPSPFIYCKPSPISLECPSGPKQTGCPPAPLQGCKAGPIMKEDPRDWIDPVWRYDYIENIGHVLVLARKSELPSPTTAAETLQQAEEYGYDTVYWNYNTAAVLEAGQPRAAGKKPKKKAATDFKPVVTKRKR